MENARVSALNDYVADLENTKKYIPSLDGLRGISIIIVASSHFISKNVPGGLGVYIFFIVSGFLIARNLYVEMDLEKSINLKQFYIRRFFRLYPVAILYAITVVGFFYALRIKIDYNQPLSALFYYSNYYYSNMFSGYGKSEPLMPFTFFWSLSIEEHFYFLFPAIFVIFKGRARYIGLCLLAVIIGCLMARVGFASRHPDLLKYPYIYFRSEFRIDSIAFGVLIASFCATSRGRICLRSIAIPPIFWLSLAVLASCLLIRDVYFRETLRYSLIGVCLTAMIVCILFSKKMKFVQLVLNNVALSFIGRLSYSIYIWHYISIYIVEYLELKESEIIVVSAEFGLSIIMALASYNLIERPFVKFGRYLNNFSRAPIS